MPLVDTRGETESRGGGGPEPFSGRDTDASTVTAVVNVPRNETFPCYFEVSDTQSGLRFCLQSGKLLSRCAQPLCVVRTMIDPRLDSAEH